MATGGYDEGWASNARSFGRVCLCSLRRIYRVAIAIDIIGKGLSHACRRLADPTLHCRRCPDHCSSIIRRLVVRARMICQLCSCTPVLHLHVPVWDWYSMQYLIERLAITAHCLVRQGLAMPPCSGDTGAESADPYLMPEVRSQPDDEVSSPGVQPGEGLMNPQDEGGGSPPRCAPMELLWRGHCGSSSPGPAPRDRRNPLSLPVGFFPAAAVVALLLLAASGGVSAQESPSPPQTPQAPPGYYNAGECEPAETGGVQNAEAIHPILSSLRSDPHISMCDAIFECPLLLHPSPPP